MSRRFGGMHPAPWGSRNGIEAFQNTLLEGIGTAFKTDGYVKIEMNAYARALFEGAIGGEALKNTWIPGTTLDLNEWEAIFGLTRNKLLNTTQRRALLSLKWQMIGQPMNSGFLVGALTEILGLQFVSVKRVTQAESIADGTAYILGGLNLTSVGGGNFPDAPDDESLDSSQPFITWGNKNSSKQFLATAMVGRSAVAHIAIQLKKPNGMSESVYWQNVEIASDFLDSAMPAWASFGFIRQMPSSNPFAVDGYASDGYLNLDNAPLQ